MSDNHHQSVPVWDLATRIFHWVLVVLVLTNIIVGGEDAGLAFQQHLVFGYLIAGLLVFRIIWGFAGSPHSLFSDFIARRDVTIDYARRVMRRAQPHYVGHNPLGGWMIVALLSLLGLLTVTGLLAHGRRTAGPLGDLLPRSAASLVGDVHALLSNLLIALIVAHVLGVLIDWLVTGVNLVRAMVTGNKLLSEVEARRERPLAPAGRAVLVAVAVALAVGWAFSTTDIASLSTPPPAAQRSRQAN